MEEVLKALGYPATAVFTFLIMGYFGKNIFENILKGFTEERKAELGRETERLKTQLGVEAEVYRLAAQKRFASLLALWESSQALFEGTDFSNRDSIKASLESLDLAVRELDKNAVLMSIELSKQIRIYLKEVGMVLTNSEKAFDENAVTSDKIGQLFKGLSGGIGVFSPSLSIVAAIGAELVPSIGKALEKKRLESAIAARVALEGTLRREFGVWISEERALVAPAPRVS
jgi:hypothetical protein